MQTLTWKSWRVFDSPVATERIKLIDSPLNVPSGVNEIVKELWNEKLRGKKEELEKKGVHVEMRSYPSNKAGESLCALYEGQKIRQWPGPVVSLNRVRDEGKVINLYVEQMFFPFIEGLYDPRVQGLYASQKMRMPKSALGVFTIALTEDKQFVLTVRGAQSYKYAGRLFGEGGHLEYTYSRIEDHLSSELSEEILVTKEEHENRFKHAGIIYDMDLLPNKPDLVGWVDIKLDSENLRERFYKRSVGKRAADARGIVFAPSTDAGLFDYLSRKTHPMQYCPTAHGGLVLFGHQNYGKEWSSKLLKKLS